MSRRPCATCAHPTSPVRQRRRTQVVSPERTCMISPSGRKIMGWRAQKGTRRYSGNSQGCLTETAISTDCAKGYPPDTFTRTGTLSTVARTVQGA